VAGGQHGAEVVAVGRVHIAAVGGGNRNDGDLLRLGVFLHKGGAQIFHVVSTAAVEQPILLKAGESVSIPTGIAISMEQSGYVAIICARSGLAFRHGLNLVNGIGVIDEDYRGEICVGLRNNSSADYVIQPGERIAQMMFMPYVQASFIAADSLDDTERGEGGFGSTGKF